MRPRACDTRPRARDTRPRARVTRRRRCVARPLPRVARPGRRGPHVRGCRHCNAQFAEEHIQKGDRIYIEGTLEYDSYEREGMTIPTADVVVREVVLLSPKEALEAAA